MCASYRKRDQFLGVAGCDLLTVSPHLLAELEQDQREVLAQLSNNHAQAHCQRTVEQMTQETFRQQIEHDLMSSQLLQSGIDGFIKAREQLSTLLRQSFGLDAEIQA